MCVTKEKECFNWGHRVGGSGTKLKRAVGEGNGERVSDPLPETCGTERRQVLPGGSSNHHSFFE